MLSPVELDGEIERFADLRVDHVQVGRKREGLRVMPEEAPPAWTRPAPGCDMPAALRAQILAAVDDVSALPEALLAFHERVELTGAQDAALAALAHRVDRDGAFVGCEQVELAAGRIDLACSLRSTRLQAA